MIKMTYVVSVLLVPLSADGELQMAMVVDVGAGRAMNEGPMEQLAVDWEGRPASTAEQARRRASIEEQARRRRKMATRVEERQMDWLSVDVEGQQAANEGKMAAER